MAGKGRGKRLTDSERMEIIASLEDPSTAVSKANCARQYGVTPAAISKLMKVSSSVKKRYSDAGSYSGGFRDKRQRGGFSKNVAFEDELYQWICSVRARNVPLLVSHVQQKAKLLASRHKMNEAFKASNGWYYRFCGRYGLTPASLHAGAPTAHQSSSVMTIEAQLESKSDDWTKLKDKVTQFGSEFVYTVSEARLFYQVLPKAVSVVTECERMTSAKAKGDDSQSVTNVIADNAEITEKNGATQTPGKIARVLVLACVNGTGTHKIPLLVIGKERVPQGLAELYPQLFWDDNTTRGSTTTSGYNGMRTTYFCQHEVWCDEKTFKHWCERVFLPAVRQRTTQPVLIVSENPGGRLSEFQQENVSTAFLPLRTTSETSEVNVSSLLPSPPTVGRVNSNANFSFQMQPGHGAVVRELKRRFKIGLLQDRLSFLEIPYKEKRRLIQRAAKKEPGTAGVALGCAPHLLDAMSLLDEAWATIPSALIKDAWIKSRLGDNSTLSASFPMAIPEQSDNEVVMELCFMIRSMNLADNMDEVANDLRHWLYIDDDSSEQMQQELLYDIQQLLHEEQLQRDNYANSTQQAQMRLHQQQSTSAFIDASGLSTASEAKQSGLVCRSADAQAAPLTTVVPSVVSDGKQKSIEIVLQALAEAEEALDNPDVAIFFGKEAVGETMENISRALRRFRRIQRGKTVSLGGECIKSCYQR